MSTKKNTAKTLVSFGEPVADLPEPRTRFSTRGEGAPHWIEAANHAKANPGVWHPITIPTLTINAHKSAVANINGASRGVRPGANRAFAQPGFRSSFRNGALYLRYDAPDTAANVRKIAG